MVPGATDGPLETLEKGDCCGSVDSDEDEELEELDCEPLRIGACFPDFLRATLLAWVRGNLGVSGDRDRTYC